MKSVCEKYGALFILDEVMSGMGSKSDLSCPLSGVVICVSRDGLLAWMAKRW